VLLRFVHLSSEVGSAAGARSPTRATAPERLLAGTSEAIGKHFAARRRPKFDTGVTPEFISVRNSG